MALKFYLIRIELQNISEEEFCIGNNNAAGSIITHLTTPKDHLYDDEEAIAVVYVEKMMGESWTNVQELVDEIHTNFPHINILAQVHNLDTKMNQVEIYIEEGKQIEVNESETPSS